MGVYIINEKLSSATRSAPERLPAAPDYSDGGQFESLGGMSVLDLLAATTARRGMVNPDEARFNLALRQSLPEQERELERLRQEIDRLRANAAPEDIAL